jgi:uncharacterized protein (DUF58 family)
VNTTELLKKVRKIEIKTRGLSKHLFTGTYHSAFKGRGMSFSEVRQYQFGDDVRTIDWNVTARTGDPYIKIFEEERELSVVFVVDISGSALFGMRQPTKQAFLTELCAVLAFSAVDNNDKVGILFFSDKVEAFIRPEKGRQHTLRIIRELLQIQPAGRGTNLRGALEYLNRILKKRSVCFILSDFMDKGYHNALRIAARRHDCIGIHCWDLRERDLPDVGLLQTLDPETGQNSWLDTTDPVLRRAYTRRFDDNFQHTTATFRQAQSDLLSLRTDLPYVKPLLQFFEKRSS